MGDIRIVRKDLEQVIQRLLGRRDPTPEVLYDVELHRDAGVDALCALLDGGQLDERKQRHALQGLAYACKHCGYAPRLKAFEAALQCLINAQTQALRSRAAHTVVRIPSLLARLRDPQFLGDERERLLGDLRRRAGESLRSVLQRGFDEQATRVGKRF